MIFVDAGDDEEDTRSFCSSWPQATKPGDAILGIQCIHHKSGSVVLNNTITQVSTERWLLSRTPEPPEDKHSKIGKKMKQNYK